MAKHFSHRRLSTFTAFLAVLVVAIAPVRGVVAACCCSTPANCCDSEDASASTAAMATSCCSGDAAESAQRSCCNILSMCDPALAGDSDSALHQTCNCDDCGCELVAAERSVATVENSVSCTALALNLWDGEPLVYAAIMPVQFSPPMLALSAHESCVRLCRWLN